jgi:hypothetical protein
MTRFRKRLPSPAMVVAIIALIAVFAGTAIAAAGLTNKAFKKQAVRAPVTYVTTTDPVPAGGPTDTFVKVQCPGGLTVIGGGIKMSSPFTIGVESSYPTTTGWAGAVYSGTATTATTTAICAKSRTTGAPPTS